MRLFFTALEYFTRWPKPRWVGHDPAWLGPCMRWFPAVGALVGAVGAAALGLATLVWSPWVAAALSTAATLLATGALHEDGLADVCDGLGGGRDRERALAIMGDSRIGAFGAIGIAIALLLKIGCLAALQPLQAMAALVCAHAVSRAGALALMRALPYAKPQADSKARPLALGVGRAEVVIGLASAVLVVAAVAEVGSLAGPLFGAAPAGRAGWLGALAAASLAVAAATALLGSWFRARVGGYTGDCLGAAQQFGEVVFYLAASALLPAS